MARDPRFSRWVHWRMLAWANVLCGEPSYDFA
jgi:hypothetical protein